jgi:hypothetical protein
MSSVVAIRSELEQRAAEFGRELAAALMLAGEQCGRDRAMMREMTAVAAGEMRKAVDWLRQGELPEPVVADYEAACRAAFESMLHHGMRGWSRDAAASAQAAA